jgi:hypothetical protein
MKKALIFAMLLALCSLVFAQVPVSGYTWTYSAGTYTEITGGMELGNSSTNFQRFVNPAVPQGDYSNTGPGFPIGFDFLYAQMIYDRVGIHADGWISLGQSALNPSVNVPSTSSPINSTLACSPYQLVSRISPLGMDLQAQSVASLRIETVGTAPNRELVVQWKNYRKYNATGDSYNFQVRLQESSNKVLFVYGTMLNGTQSATAQVGLRAEPASPASNWKNLASNISWTPTVDGAYNDAIVVISSTVYPPSGTTYTWTHPEPVVPNPIFLSNPSHGSTNVNLDTTLIWSAGGGSPTGYRINMWTTNPHTVILDDVDLGHTQLYNPGGLAFGTTYYWQIIPYNEVGDAVNCPVLSFSTLENPAKSLPYTQDFNGISHLGAIEWQGDMNILANHGTAGSHGLTKNIWSSNPSGWAASPPIGPMTNGVKVSFDYRVVNYFSYPAYATPLGSEDKIEVQISTNEGAAYYTVHTVDWNNHVTSNSFATRTVNLGAYTSGYIHLRFFCRGSWDKDYYVDIDNVLVSEQPSYGEFSINPTVKAFGSIAMNRAVSQIFNIRNNGEASLGISSVEITEGAAHYSISVPVPPAGSSLAPGASTSFTLRYMPTTSGAHPGVITINYNDGRRGIATVNLSGTGFDASVSEFPYVVDFSTWPALNWTQLVGPYPNLPWSGTQWYADDWLNVTSPVNKAAKINIYGSMRYGWLVSPPIKLSVDGIRLSFDAALLEFNSTSAPTTLQPDDRFLLVMSDSADMSNPTLLREWNNSGSEWVFNNIPCGGENYALTLAGITGTKYFAFYGESRVTGNGNNDFMVDNVRFDLPDFPEDQTITIGEGEDAITVTISLGSANNAEDTEIPPFNNGDFVVQQSLVLDFLGAGPWTVSISGNSPWAAYYKDGAWNSVETSGGIIAFSVAAGQEQSMPIILGNADPTLPVELSGFVAMMYQGNSVMLRWQTHSETNVSGYRIYRGASAQLADAIVLNVFIDAANSSQTQHYVYYDRELHIPGSYFYWLESVDFDGSNQLFGPLSVLYEGAGTSVPGIPVLTGISKNYPNPFNPHTRLVYGVEKEGLVNITVFNAKGQKVRNLLHTNRQSGWHHIDWDGKNDHGKELGSGVYYFRMQAEGKVINHKTVLMK